MQSCWRQPPEGLVSYGYCDDERYSLAEQLLEVVRDRGLGLYELIPRQIRYTWPMFGCRCAKDLENDLQLMDLVAALKHRLLGEKLQHDAST